MATTISEVARRAKVSPGLVYRLARKDPTLRVSDKTVRRIRAVEERLGGIRVHRAARSLSTKLSYNIVLPMNDIFVGRPMSEPAKVLMKNLEAGIRGRDFRLSLNYFDQDNYLAYFQDLSDSPDYCDGIVLLNGIINTVLERFLQDRHVPHIVIDAAAEQFDVNTVATHAVGGIRQAVTHLQELGHRNIGFLGPEHGGRFPMFLAVMAERGLPVDSGLNCFLPTENIGLETTGEWTNLVKRIFPDWLNGRRPPATTAFICQNDVIAQAAVEVLREHGLRPGRDLSLVGYDNIEERGDTPSARPMLTTIDNPVDLVGRRAADSLINQILHKQRQIVHEHIPMKLIVRETTGTCIQREETS